MVERFWISQWKLDDPGPEFRQERGGIHAWGPGKYRYWGSDDLLVDFPLTILCGVPTWSMTVLA